MDNPTALLALGRHLRQSGYRFLTVTPETHRRVNARPENRWARRLEDVLGWSRPFRRDLLPPAVFELMGEAGILSPHEDGWRCSLRASTLDDLLLFHSGYPTVANDAVFFGPDTYRFAAALLGHLSSLGGRIDRVFEIGCGSGAAGLLAARVLPEARIFLGDINEAALSLARINAAINDIENVSVGYSDLLSGIDGSFDLIVANPPYLVDASERAYRHGGGALGAGLSLAIIDTAVPRLGAGGSLLLYTGSAIVDGQDAFFAEAKERIARTGCSWCYREVDPDVFGEELETPAYAHADRIAAVVFTALQAS